MERKHRHICKEKLREEKANFQQLLQTHFENMPAAENLNEANEAFNNAITTSAKEIAGVNEPQTLDKLSAETKGLLQKRRMMKKERQTGPNHEYSQLQKDLRKKMKEDIRAFNTGMVRKALENNRSVKTARRNLDIGKPQIQALKAEDGSVIINRDKILKRVEEFYQQLYDVQGSSATPSQKTTPDDTGEEEPVPEVTPSEVERALKDCLLYTSPSPRD